MKEYELNFQENVKDNYLLLKVIGPINSYTYDIFKEKVLSIVQNNNLVLDLSDVSDLTSTGVGVLFELREKAEENGKRLVLLSPSKVVKHVVGLTGFLELFEVVDKEEDIKIN
jgi:anti-anti-sigma factor